MLESPEFQTSRSSSQASSLTGGATGSAGGDTGPLRNLRRWRRSSFAVVVVLLAAAIPNVGLQTSTIFILATVAVYAVGAAGLSVLYGQGGQLSVAHGAVIAVSAYATNIFVLKLSWPFAAAVVASLLMSTLAALVVSAPAARLRGHYFVIVTFAAAELAALAAAHLAITGKTAGLSVNVSESKALSWLSQTEHLYYVSWGCLIATMITLHLIRRTKFSSDLVALRENEDLARSLGVQVVARKVTAFALSGVIGGLAGILLLCAFLYISPDDLSSSSGIIYIMILLVGGSRHLLGPLVGAAVYVSLPHVLGLSANYLEIAIGIIVVLVILVMPEGIAGAGEKAFVHLRARVGR